MLNRISKSTSEFGQITATDVFGLLETNQNGLSTDQVNQRRAIFGLNQIQINKADALQVLFRQLNNPILWLLSFALLISALLGDSTNALIIVVIVLMSIAMGFLTEYRAEKAIEDLHSRITHHATVLRDGKVVSILNSELVPGDVVKLRIGSVVPADMRLFEVDGLECDESIITGESLPVAKDAKSANMALMGTVVRIGSGTGVVCNTAGSTEFGRIAEALSDRPPLTNFQIGLKQFSIFLLKLAIAITSTVLIGNLFLKRSIIESVLYSLALAVGMTPQLLPAIVSTALAMGSKQLAKQGVLIKRLISIEDLGDLDVIITDKTGTLTSGNVSYESSYPVGDTDPISYGLLATDGDFDEIKKSFEGLSPLDSALWISQNTKFPADVRKIAELAFDHNRRRSSSLIDLQSKRILVTKGSPDEVIKCCKNITNAEVSLLNSLYQQGARVIAVAFKDGTGLSAVKITDENELNLIGFLTFSDPPKADVEKSLINLQQMGIEIKLATGDSLEVSQTVCEKVGLPVKGTMLGSELEKFGDEELAVRAIETTIFARVSPEQKARIIIALKSMDKSIGFLGDGVNDAIALHDADVGVSVDSATDVAKDAADVVLLEKDLGVLANGIRLGRRVFNNTMKYIFMATSADFGNLISASIGSLFLPFLPMLPTQLMLQDLLYDSSQLAIPTDNVDNEQVAKPSHWNILFIRRFMLVFGLASSIFDFITFAFLLWFLHAKQVEFNSGWFIESLATATLVVLVIRTRRVPFFTSRPSKQLLLALVGVNVIAFLITISPFAKDLGFRSLPLMFYFVLGLIVISYLGLVELAKKRLFHQV